MTAVLSERTAVADRILNENPVGVAQVARLIGTFRDGRPTSPATVARWIAEGVRRPDGTVLRLEAFRLHGRYVTSRAALLRFIAAQNEDVPAGRSTGTPDAPARADDRRRATVEAELVAAGL